MSGVLFFIFSAIAFVSVNKISTTNCLVSINGNLSLFVGHRFYIRAHGKCKRDWWNCEQLEYPENERDDVCFEWKYNNQSSIHTGTGNVLCKTRFKHQTVYEINGLFEISLPIIRWFLIHSIRRSFTWAHRARVNLTCYRLIFQMFRFAISWTPSTENISWRVWNIRSRICHIPVTRTKIYAIICAQKKR